MASCWSGRRGSNSLPPPWQGGALPDELRPHIRHITAPFRDASDRNRTNDTGIFSPLLYRLSYRGIGAISACAEMAATRIGLEPTTPSVTGWCSNQLSYRAMIAQVHRFWRLTAGTCVIIPEKRAVVKHEFQKMSKKFGKVRHSGKNTKTKRTEYSLCACGRGSKSRTHGTRFWRPLLYQLSYTPIYLSHSLNA